MSRRSLRTKAAAPGIASRICWTAGRTRWRAGRRRGAAGARRAPRARGGRGGGPGRPRRGGARLRRTREVGQVGALGVVELQRPGQRAEDALRDAAHVPALQARVIRDADAREHRDLLAAQARYAARPVGRQAGLLRRDPRSPGGQELADLGAGVHCPGSVDRRAPCWGTLGVSPSQGLPPARGSRLAGGHMGARRSNRAVLAVILVGYLLILIDVSILIAALPQIHADLGFSPAGLSWAQNAYTLTFGGLLLL